MTAKDVIFHKGILYVLCLDLKPFILFYVKKDVYDGYRFFHRWSLLKLIQEQNCEFTITTYGEDLEDRHSGKKDDRNRMVLFRRATLEDIIKLLEINELPIEYILNWLKKARVYNNFLDGTTMDTIQEAVDNIIDK